MNELKNNKSETSGATPFRRGGALKADKITMAHGSGGKAMRDLIDDVFINSFDNPAMGEMEDQARIDLATLQAEGDRLAFTTDSFVVDPLFFPGGDIGKLAIFGTVNDLAVGGAKPLYLTCSMIIEEGLEIDVLRKVAGSMRAAADLSGVSIVTGDTKVVDKGACDKVFINTAGVGVIPKGTNIGAKQVRPGDKLLVNGVLGDHGAAILNARGDMALTSPVLSDCKPLYELIKKLLAAAPGTSSIRDATRGGLASAVNEIADAAGLGVTLIEDAIPLRKEVRGFCEILGLDPLYLANEGTLVAFVPAEQADDALAAMQSLDAGKEAAIIGEAVEGHSGRVIMQSSFGGKRIVDMLVGDQLPRIC